MKILHMGVPEKEVCQPDNRLFQSSHRLGGQTMRDVIVMNAARKRAGSQASKACSKVSSLFHDIQAMSTMAAKRITTGNLPASANLNMGHDQGGAWCA